MQLFLYFFLTPLPFAMGRPKKDDTGSPTIIRLHGPLLEQIEAAAKALNWSSQQVMREAMKLGLEGWKRIGYDLTGAVLDRTEKAKSEESEIALLAEKGTGYRTKNKGRIDVRNAAAPLPTYLVLRKAHILEPLTKAVASSSTASAADPG
jgi:hypothetical protein